MRIRLGVEANFEPTPKAAEKEMAAEMREAQLVLENARAAARILELEEQNALIMLELTQIKAGV
ncbi:hypothetical protein P4U99_03380 [Brevibacillus agri]|uniref:hypothetical protein n=1 Tax=Brevibacillus agri TaxID=51101 RepID=UPI002E22E7E8|nr:hypothetical protein [Brevibacillus agri]MED1652607.1 hypothetical protein [Brevibacillus agri]MED1689639.1 hypothetical protein [Brevibacillus agri]MED1691123.1 hypothetical protein [Brevibacillus agri]MED1696767.1 hypothetical protein [Brevibacillus agri]